MHRGRGSSGRKVPKAHVSKHQTEQGPSRKTLRVVKYLNRQTVEEHAFLAVIFSSLLGLITLLLTKLFISLFTDY